MAHQDVHGRAQAGVGGDAREAVRAAALQPDLEVAGAHGGAPCFVGDGQHFLNGADARFNRGAGAAHVLHHHGAQQLAFSQALRIDQRIDLVALTPQAHDEHARQVGVARVARQRAAQHVKVFAGGRHAAAAGLGKGGHAIHVGVGGQPLGREVRGNALDDGGRAVHRRQDADEIARAHAATRPHKALEGGAFGLGHVIHRLHVGAKGRVAVVVHQLQVVAVHVVAGLQVARGHANHGVVFFDLLARCNAARGNLVAGGHLGARAHPQFRNLLPQGQSGFGHQHVVVGVQVQQRAIGS